MRRKKAGQFLLQSLEKRLLFTSTPATPRAVNVVTLADRQALFARLTNLNSTTRSTLQSDLNASNSTKFDSDLLSYMRNRTGPKYFFDPADTSSIGSFIKNNSISYSAIQTNADAVTNSHLFPDQTNATTYTVDLASNITWLTPGGSTNPEFKHALNRHVWWQELAWAAAITGDPNDNYAHELEYELASWSQQVPTMATPTVWNASDQNGWLLDTSTRADIWTQAYFGFLDDSAFTGAENSLFLYKLTQTGDFLYKNAVAVTPYMLKSNKTISLAQGLLILGDMFPEIDNSTKWQGTARNVMVGCMDNQIYNDGSHVEQSPGYAFNVADDILGAYYLDQGLNGHAWNSKYKTKLTNLVDSYWQELSPNGSRPAIGDTFRVSSFGAFLKAGLILGVNRWPAARPRIADVWLLGTDAVTPYLPNPNTPASLGSRGTSYGLKDSGNYIMRSGNDTNARQINFDAGPQGGVHGHYDLLNFELSGYGRPLISDPGAYVYDTSADRAYVISTKAHNTLNVDGLNVGELEGSNNGSILVSQWDTDANHSQVTATHWGYEYLPGQPVLTRSMWYDNDGTIIIVDWADSTTNHTFSQSYNLQTENTAGTVKIDTANFTAYTNYATGGNVKIQAIQRTGQTDNFYKTFVTNTASGDYKDDAYRYTVSQTGSYVCFVTLITAYNGVHAPNITASLLNNPLASGGIAKVQLNNNGVTQEVDFARPPLKHLSSTVAAANGTHNDIAFDASKQLHLAYYDPDTKDLMYAIRGTNGKWSIPQVVAHGVNPTAPGEYQYISLALNQQGVPSIAYYDAWNGDLDYAYFDTTMNSWQTQVVDAKGSTGLYPDLAFSRSNGPVISYYNRTNGDLVLAQSITGGGFSLTPIDTVGDVGRYTTLMLDPNRPTASKWAIGYTDQTHNSIKYAIQGSVGGGTQLNGFSNFTVKKLTQGAADLSIGFYNSGLGGSKPYKPAMSYYDVADTGLWLAKATDDGATWKFTDIASKGTQGQYSNLFFDSNNNANIYYYNTGANQSARAIVGKSISYTVLGSGGEELHIARGPSGWIGYTALDETLGELDVRII